MGSDFSSRLLIGVVSVSVFLLVESQEGTSAAPQLKLSSGGKQSGSKTQGSLENLDLDNCPLTKGHAAKADPTMWKVLELLITTNTRVAGPNQQAIFHLAPLFQSLNHSATLANATVLPQCLVCYTYSYEKVPIATRLMCDDESDAYFETREIEPNTMYITMTRVEIPSGFSKGFDCNVSLYQHVVLNSTADTTLQCWLRPILSDLVVSPPGFSEAASKEAAEPPAGNVGGDS